MHNHKAAGKVAMPFPNEKKFVDAVVSSIQTQANAFGFSSFRISREVAAGRQIADIVVLGVPEGCQIGEVPALSVTECVLLASLRNLGKTRVDLLEKRCGMKAAALRDGPLDRLVASGLVERQRGGGVSLGFDAFSSVEIIAVEAKLTKWRDALAQARGYRRYANRSFVILPKLTADAAVACKSEFLSHGVGLVTFDDGLFDVVCAAAACDDHDWRREYVYSRVAKGNTMGRSRDTRRTAESTQS